MKDIVEILKKYKIAVIVIVALLLLMFVRGTVIPKVYYMRESKVPVKSITAETAEKKYRPGSQLDEEDFCVVAIHTDGAKTRLRPSEYKVTNSKLGKLEGAKKATVILNKNHDITADCLIHSARTKVDSWDISKNKDKGAMATLYSTGELHFSGKEATIDFTEDDAPWKESYSGDDSSEEKGEDVVKYVTFDPDTNITDLSGAFSDMPYISYVGKLPASVVSINEAFKNDTALTGMAEWSDSSVVTAMSAYDGCTALKKTSPAPATLTDATSMFNNCSTLPKGMDVSKAVTLKNAGSMYQECSSLMSATVPAHADTMDSMFAGCIKLRTAPVIPEGAVNCESMFSGCQLLTTASSIPKTVKNTNSMFKDCSILRGDLMIDANPDDLDDMLNDAGTSTVINLKGKSKMLKDIAVTAGEEARLSINGKRVSIEKIMAEQYS